MIKIKFELKSFYFENLLHKFYISCYSVEHAYRLVTAYGINLEEIKFKKQLRKVNNKFSDVGLFREKNGKMERVK